MFYFIGCEGFMVNNYTKIHLHDSDVRTEPIHASGMFSIFIIMVKSH